MQRDAEFFGKTPLDVDKTLSDRLPGKRGIAHQCRVDFNRATPHHAALGHVPGQQRPCGQRCIQFGLGVQFLIDLRAGIHPWGRRLRCSDLGLQVLDGLEDWSELWEIFSKLIKLGVAHSIRGCLPGLQGFDLLLQPGVFSRSLIGARLVDRRCPAGLLQDGVWHRVLAVLGQHSDHFHGLGSCSGGRCAVLLHRRGVNCRCRCGGSGRGRCADLQLLLIVGVAVALLAIQPFFIGVRPVVSHRGCEGVRVVEVEVVGQLVQLLCHVVVGGHISRSSYR